MAPLLLNLSDPSTLLWIIAGSASVIVAAFLLNKRLGSPDTETTRAGKWLVRFGGAAMIILMTAIVLLAGLSGNEPPEFGLIGR